MPWNNYAMLLVFNLHLFGKMCEPFLLTLLRGLLFDCFHTENFNLNYIPVGKLHFTQLLRKVEKCIYSDVMALVF